MIIRHNIPIYSICWLSHTKGGNIGTFYEPENRTELADICRKLYSEGKLFDIIGYTSNIYYLPSYNVETMVSTRKVRDLDVKDDCIVADCGVSVSKLSRQMVEKGVKGFEGLIDLPGTVAASVYGNASCYGCSINALLISCELLQADGEIVTIKPDKLKLSKRSSVLKRGELKGVLLSAKLKRELGNCEEIKSIAERNQQTRKNTQPGPSDNLGSIYRESGSWSLYSILPRLLTKIYEVLFLFNVTDSKERKRRKMSLLFHLIGGTDVFPYVYDWNRYIWKDERSHVLFWKFHRLHQKMFKQSKFEIEIKGAK